MKYAVLKVINGNFSVHAEGFTDVDKATRRKSIGISFALRFGTLPMLRMALLAW